MLQIITGPTPTNATANDGVASAPVQATDSGSRSHPLARAVSCPPPGSGNVLPVVNGHEPEPKHLKSIIKKTWSNGTQSGDMTRDTAASGDAEHTSDYTKQTSVSSKSSVGSSDRKGVLSRSCCVVS